eukprot:14204334-Ditylum_brightwellii.AAC.1
MMHDLQEEWERNCKKKGIILDQDNSSTIIMDNSLLYSLSQQKALQICRCCWKLKKCQWAPKELEFVGFDISIQGNSPA